MDHYDLAADIASISGEVAILQSRITELEDGLFEIRARKAPAEEVPAPVVSTPRVSASEFRAKISELANDFAELAGDSGSINGPVAADVHEKIAHPVEVAFDNRIRGYKADLQDGRQHVDPRLQSGNLFSKIINFLRFLHHGVLVKDVVLKAAGRLEPPGSTHSVRPDPGPSNVRISRHHDQS